MDVRETITRFLIEFKFRARRVKAGQVVASAYEELQKSVAVLNIGDPLGSSLKENGFADWNEFTKARLFETPDNAVAIGRVMGTIEGVTSAIIDYLERLLRERTLYRRVEKSETPTELDISAGALVLYKNGTLEPIMGNLRFFDKRQDGSDEWTAGSSDDVTDLVECWFRRHTVAR